MSIDVTATGGEYADARTDHENPLRVLLFRGLPSSGGRVEVSSVYGSDMGIEVQRVSRFPFGGEFQGSSSGCEGPKGAVYRISTYRFNKDRTIIPGSLVLYIDAVGNQVDWPHKITRTSKED